MGNCTTKDRGITDVKNMKNSLQEEVNWTDLKKEKMQKAAHKISDILVLEDLNEILICNESNQLTIWDSRSLAHKSTLPLSHHAQRLYRINEEEFVSCPFGGSHIQIWNVTSKKVIQTLSEGSQFVLVIMMVSNNIMLSASEDDIYIWMRVNSGLFQLSFKRRFIAQNFYSCMLKLSDNCFASANKGSINFFQLSITESPLKIQIQLVSKIKVHTEEYIKDLKLIGLHDDYLLSRSYRNAVKLWDVQTRKLLRTFVWKQNISQILVLSLKLFAIAGKGVGVWNIYTGDDKAIQGNVSADIRHIKRLYKSSLVISLADTKLEIWKC